ncbi:hypothetical protein [Pedobacter hartonius]|uniref:Uncharacterized protein n=1 Tax=Pedobacter hartonius TaxID=425514 RepID=A0A1H3WD84_9SPHI|nr:hypothetical protein [Pedobacter hartonius]SDZ84791.1 hypothetical protein SAMN05443550_101193 [Pedobacter hartonius]
MLFNSCFLLRRNTKSTDESYNKVTNTTDSNVTVSTNKRKNMQQFIYRKDSAGADYTIQFWPKGVFNFSPGTGFTGEFDSILMKGKQKQLIETTGTLNSGEFETGKSAIGLHQKRQLNSGKKMVDEMGKYDFKLVAIILIVLGLAFLGFKRWQR